MSFHLLFRTSPMGEPFVGRCMLCGADGLKPGEVLGPCPNPSGKTQEESLLLAIDPPDDTPEVKK